MAKKSMSTAENTAANFTLEINDEDHYTLLSVKDIAARLGMSILSVRKLVHSGALPKVATLTPNSPIRVSVASLKRLIKDRSVIMIPREAAPVRG